MPGDRREKTRCLADVTIGQFADASEPVARPAKRISNRRAIICRLVDEDPAAADADDHAEATDDGDIDDGDRRMQRQPPPTLPPVIPVVYPAMLWQVLGEYIHPDSVGAFAATCRDARRVTQRRSFWRGLYLRWAWGPVAAADPAAPHELRRAAILDCHQWVRPRVIRALHRWHFTAGSVAVSPMSPQPVGLRFLRFAVRDRRLLVLFRRGPPPPPPRPVPDSWEEAAASGGAGELLPDQRCPTEGQWLLTAKIDGSGCSPACLEELLALDDRYVLVGLRYLSLCGAGVGSAAAKAAGGGGCCGSLTSSSGGSRWCELTMRAPHGESRAIGFACGGSGSRSPLCLLPWWRPEFQPALRE